MAPLRRAGVRLETVAQGQIDWFTLQGRMMDAMVQEFKAAEQKAISRRVMTEQLRDRRVDLLDGIKVFDERGWAEILPDPDEPVVHIYAEGTTKERSKELEDEFRSMVEEIVERESAASTV